MQIINTRKIFKKIINQNITKNIYKEYNIINQKTFENRKSQKLIRTEEYMKKTSKLIKVILAFALIIGAVSFNSSFAAGQDVEINETNFPDPTFREYVKRFDNNRNGKLSTTEINVVKNIDVSEKNIKSIKGVEFFVHLEELECVKNKISDINAVSYTHLTLPTKRIV